MGLFWAKHWAQLLIIGVLSGLFLWYSYSIYQRGWDTRDSDWKADTLKRELYAQAEAKKMQLAYDQIEIAMSVVEAQQNRKRDVERIEVEKWRTEYHADPDTGKCDLLPSFVCSIDTAYEGLPEAAYHTCLETTPVGGLTDRGVVSWGQEIKRICAAYRDEVMWWRDERAKLEATR